ncbi:antibiotic biosynthesis monooxygenase [Oleomonas cavernae]|uniref:antibiotic biosynthesis monooxygenase n=1 Tax=Oleomonas cavernae TaxID=2320859 RepID=UPI0018F2E779|nr:antibiotic biosynthesis monooxygenase [Oleomonas cavernae]
MSDVVWLKQLKEADQSRRVYRVDKFVVPQAARPEFLAKIRETHAMLATLPGFVRDVVLEQCGGPGEFNLVTLVEWESAEAFEEAKAAVWSRHARMKFDPHAMFARLGIRADLGNYAALAS